MKQETSKKDLEFAANAAHEFRIPITVIRGFAEALQNPSLSSQTLCEISERILRASQKLENLVTALLTLAEAKHLSDAQLRPINLVSIVEQCKQFAIVAHKTAEIHLVAEKESICILGDFTLLELAIANLLDNAVKYSPSPAQIAVSVREEKNQAQLLIQDKGIGISEADLPFIFDRFYKAHQTHASRSGSAGLGLSLAKTVIEKHGGTLAVASQLGLGSLFTIEIPLLK